MQVIASRVAYGPHSSTFTVAVSTPSPPTSTLSVMVAPGFASCALTCVASVGVPVTTVVSTASPHAVSAGRTSSVSGIDSTYV